MGLKAEKPLSLLSCFFVEVRRILAKFDAVFGALPDEICLGWSDREQGNVYLQSTTVCGEEAKGTRPALPPEHRRRPVAGTEWFLTSGNMKIRKVRQLLRAGERTQAIMVANSICDPDLRMHYLGLAYTSPR